MTFVGVAWNGDDEAFQGFVDEHDLTFPQISDDPGAVYEMFDVPAQPALVVVSADGTVQRMLGAVEPEELDRILTDATA